MKKFLILSCALFASVSAMAQLRVNSNGNVSIQGSTTNVSPLSIGGGGNTYFSTYINSLNGGIYAIRTGTPERSYNWIHAGQIINHNRSGYFNIGLRGCASSYVGSGRAYGVFGEASGATNGYKYGVFGRLNLEPNVTGNQFGAAVYGTTSSSENGIYVSGRYAGFFNGDVRVNGDLYATLLTESEYESNSLQLMSLSSDETVSDKLSQLSAVQYNLASSAISPTATNISGTDTLETTTLSTVNIQSLEKNHYGLNARELQTLYPDLVYENQQGKLCINYIEMIPLLVESIKELKAEIAELQGGNNGGVVLMSRSLDNANSMEENSLTIPVLEQNNPNPFTENTVIGYTLPESVQTAILYIYDMNGTQVHQMTLTERGSSSVTVSGGELSAGMYLYSLIADGKVIDTKRMILTK